MQLLRGERESKNPIKFYQIITVYLLLVHTLKFVVKQVNKFSPQLGLGLHGASTVTSCCVILSWDRQYVTHCIWFNLFQVGTTVQM